MEQSFFKQLREVLDTEDKDIQLTDKFKDYAEWDSLTHLSLIAMLDESYGVIIPPDEFKKINTVGELLEEIKRRKQ